MKRLSLMMAVLLIPTGVMAQGFHALADEDDGYEAPLSVIGSGDHPPSTTETSPARARVVRRNGQTIPIAKAAAEQPQATPTRLANIGN